MPVGTEPIGLFLGPLTLIAVTIGVDQAAISFDLIVQEVSLIHASIRPDYQPLTIASSAVHLAEIANVEAFDDLGLVCSKSHTGLIVAIVQCTTKFFDSANHNLLRVGGAIHKFRHLDVILD